LIIKGAREQRALFFKEEKSKSLLFSGMKAASEPTKKSCPNCGTQKAGNFCANCGQKFFEGKLSLTAVTQDSIDTLFNIDNRVLKTLKDLFLKPGYITKQYLAGKRQRYISPFRVYFTFSALYFFVLSITEVNSILFMNSFDLDGNEEQFTNFMKSFIILFAPAFAGVIHLLHRKQGKNYIESLVLALHLHSVLFFLFIVRAITDHFMLIYTETGGLRILIIGISATSTILLFYYMYSYLREFFGQSIMKTVLKVFLMLQGYVVILIIALLIFIFTISG
jgi:hypothetical protein|tara:strand:- start:223 stop:1059 length:837 start_codon:yes stop_codon:yes gene_type:complete